MLFVTTRESRRAAVLRKYEDPSVWETTKEDVMIRRNDGYAAVEKWMKEKHIDLCSIQDGEVIGDTEVLMNLSTYMQTVKCTANTNVYILDLKNFERLVGKRNPHTMNIMRESVKAKLKTRAEMKNGEHIPFLNFLHCKLNEQTLPPPKELPPLKTSKSLPDNDTRKLYLLKAFKEGKAPLVEPLVPGGVYYKSLMKYKAVKRETIRKEEETSSPTGVPTKRRVSKPRRQPRSIMAIRASLQEMMAAEILEYENEHAKKKMKSKFGSTTSVAKSNASSLPSLSHRENKQEKENKPHISFDRSIAGQTNQESFISLLNQKTAPGKGNEDSNKRSQKPKFTSTPRSNSVESTPQEILEVEKAQKRPQNKPVLITEMTPRKDIDLPELPAIKEEQTQEEIHLNSSNHQRKKSNFEFSSSQNKKSNKVPELKLPKINTNNNHSVRDVSLDNSFSSTYADKNDHVTTLPSIPVATLNSEDENPKPSKWSSAMKFVNETVQQNLAQNALDTSTDGGPNDHEFQNESIKLIERKIDAFNIKYGGKAKRLPTLAKFSLDVSVTVNL